MAHRTQRSLNDNLRVARLTVPQWIAAGVGALSLWMCAGLAAGIHNPNAHILAVALPTVLLVAPILAFGRGGIERYPQQATRYALRVTRRAMGQSVVTLETRLVSLRAKRGYHAPTTDACPRD